MVWDGFPPTVRRVRVTSYAWSIAIGCDLAKTQCLKKIASAGKFPKVTIGIDGAIPQTNLSYVPNAEMPPILQILIKRVEIFGISGKSSKFRLDFFSQVDFLEIGWISGKNH